MSRREREIWQACDDLLALGKTPREITGEAIGNRLRELSLKPGSLTYRYRYRDSWMEERGLTRENLEDLNNKPSDIIERSAAIFRKTIEDSIREEYEIKLAEATKEIIAVNERWENTQGALTTISKIKDELTTQLTSANREISEVSKKLLQEREKRIQYEERTFSAEQHNQRMQQDYDKRLDEFKVTQEQNLKAYEERYTALEAQHQLEIDKLMITMESQRHAWLVEKDALQVEKTKLEKQLDKSRLLEKLTQEKIASQTEHCQKLEADKTSVKSEYKTLEKKYQLNLLELASSKAENTVITDNSKSLKAQNEALQSQLLSSKEQLGRLEERIVAAMSQIDNLKDKLKHSRE